MNKYIKLADAHLDARVLRDKVASDLLGTILGEVQTILKGTDKLPDDTVEDVVKKAVKNLEVIGTDLSKREIELLQPYLPETMTEAQIVEALDKADLAPSMNFGQKMGIAMKTVGGKADGAAVKRIVMKYYN